MSNKSQLQLNNTDLQSILSTVLGLPTQESLKHGAYVWKRSKIITPTATLTFTVTSATSTNDFKVTSPDVDLTTVDSSFFAGISGTLPSGTLYSFVNSTTFKVGPTEMPYTYDAINTTISVSTNFGEASGGVFTYTKEAVMGDTDFTVSDSPTAYPDGGIQDGYLYEKVVEGVDLLAAYGCTKMAVDKFTPTSRTESSSFPISHSLGENPKFVLLTATSDSSVSNDICDVFVRNRPSSNIDYWLKGAVLVTAPSGQGGVVNSTLNLSSSYINDTELTISLSGYYYTAGIEYTLITMA